MKDLFITAIPLTLLVIACLSNCAKDDPGPTYIREHHEALPVSRNPVFARHDLIEIREVDRSCRIDLQYKQPNNITGKPLYSGDFPALLRPSTAVRVAFANKRLEPHGFKLKIWDAYRPPAVQEALFLASGGDDEFVADPSNAPSQHSCGTAVDVTMVHRDGREARMPTHFDSFSRAARSRQHHPDPEIRQNLAILQQAMEDAGFYPLAAEWWHYIDQDFKSYPQTIMLRDIADGF